MFKPSMGYYLNKVEKVPESGCWIWLGTTSKQGYGRVRVGSRQTMAHRFFYESLIGAIPVGLQIDHLCRVRCCVNPAHMEPVTGRVNTERGFNPFMLNKRKTHCKNGHEYTTENTFHKNKDGLRQCRICKNLGMKRLRGERVFNPIRRKYEPRMGTVCE